MDTLTLARLDALHQAGHLSTREYRAVIRRDFETRVRDRDRAGIRL